MSFPYYYDPRVLYLSANQPPRSAVPYQISSLAIENELNLGRSGHFYRTHINGYGTAQVQLLSYDPVNELVHINLQLFNGSFRKMEIHPADLVGLTYLGPVPPKPLTPFCAVNPWHPACQ
ncbi:hypothetical protein ABGV43_30250 [Paenibacillus amylolyticus]|uniref:hypothetical protein n=1 Tax=Paenibacillus amylolyticus TaxID=1451 RepID=UPI00324258C6